MISLLVNGVPVEFNDDISMDIVIREALKHSKFSKFAGVKKNYLLYLKNGKLVKYDNLSNHKVKDGDEISILAITSGG